MTYILVMILALDNGKTLATTSVRFNSQTACLDASKAIVNDINTRKVSASFASSSLDVRSMVCVPEGVK